MQLKLAGKSKIVMQRNDTIKNIHNQLQKKLGFVHIIYKITNWNLIWFFSIKQTPEVPLKHKDSFYSKSSLPSSVNPVSRDDVLVENSNSRDSKKSENMPLYPHSILKKVSSARKISHPTLVQDEPTIDYSTDDGEKDELDDVNPKSSLTQTTKSQKLSKNSVIDDSPLDRPTAKPGKRKIGFLP